MTERAGELSGDEPDEAPEGFREQPRYAPMVQRAYENDRIEVTWEPAFCIHVGECLRGLPAVFDNQRRPWIIVDNGSPAEIGDVIQRCPTGALHFRRLDGATDYLEADLRGFPVILRAAARSLDFGEPVALMLLIVLHLIPDADDPYGIVAALPASGHSLVRSRAQRLAHRRCQRALACCACRSSSSRSSSMITTRPSGSLPARWDSTSSRTRRR